MLIFVVHYLCDYIVVLHILIYTPMIVPPKLKMSDPENGLPQRSDLQVRSLLRATRDFSLEVKAKAQVTVTVKR